jgi:hypothetical protein
MNWKSTSSVAELSVSSAISPNVAVGGGAKPSVFAFRLSEWMLKRTPSDDRKVMSESLELTELGRQKV